MSDYELFTLKNELDALKQHVKELQEEVARLYRIIFFMPGYTQARDREERANEEE